MYFILLQVLVSAPLPAPLSPSDIENPLSDYWLDARTTVTVAIAEKLGRPVDSVVVKSTAPILGSVTNSGEFQVWLLPLPLTSSAPLLTPTWLSPLLHAAPTAPMTVLAVDPVPLCGNGVCEAGEIPSPTVPTSLNDTMSTEASCPTDCTLAATRCPVGPSGTSCNAAGSCVVDGDGVGQCMCFAAFAGASCSQCASGYIARGHGADGRALCVRVMATATDPSSPPLTPGGIAGVVVGGGAGIMFIIGLLYRRRRRQEAQEESARDMSVSSGPRSGGPSVGREVHVLSPLAHLTSTVRPEDVTSRVNPEGATLPDLPDLPGGVEVDDLNVKWASPRASTVSTDGTAKAKRHRTLPAQGSYFISTRGTWCWGR